RRSRSAASGGCSEAEEGKTTSRQEGLQPVEVCDDCFSGSQRLPASAAVLVTFDAKSDMRSIGLCGRGFELLEKPLKAGRTTNKNKQK
ncbi:MAG: hypothetical protein IJO54_07020, partial [Oscillospiraceae bacterium]|nr:hypothetical protein [Oscillospiraceae bacterium]